MTTLPTVWKKEKNISGKVEKLLQSMKMVAKVCFRTDFLDFLQPFVKFELAIKYH